MILSASAALLSAEDLSYEIDDLEVSLAAALRRERDAMTAWIAVSPSEEAAALHAYYVSARQRRFDLEAALEAAERVRDCPALYAL